MRGSPSLPTHGDDEGAQALSPEGRQRGVATRNDARSKALNLLLTDAQMAFALNHERAQKFLQIHEEVQRGRGAPPVRYRELPRAAVVFSIGALDAYLADVLASVIVQQVRRGAASRDARALLREIDRDVPGLSIELALAARDIDRVRLLESALTDHFQSRSNMGARAVSVTVQRMGAHPSSVWDEVSKGVPDAQRELDRWTAVRHDIVHRGKTPTVRRNDANDCLTLVGSVVVAVDAVAVSA